MSIMRRRMMLSQSDSVLCVIAQGSQLVNTGYIIKANTRVLAKMKMLKDTGNYYFGDMDNERDAFRFFHTGGIYYRDIGSDREQSSANLTNDDVIIDFSANGLKVSKGNEIIASQTNVMSSYAENGHLLKLFGDSQCVLYWMEVFEGESLVMDIVPAYHDGFCLYDKVSDTYIRASNTMNGIMASRASDLASAGMWISGYDWMGRTQGYVVSVCENVLKWNRTDGSWSDDRKNLETLMTFDLTNKSTITAKVKKVERTSSIYSYITLYTANAYGTEHGSTSLEPIALETLTAGDVISLDISDLSGKYIVGLSVNGKECIDLELCDVSIA